MAATPPPPSRSAVAVAAAISIGVPGGARGTSSAAATEPTATVIAISETVARVRPAAFRIAQPTASSARQHSPATRIGSASAPSPYSGL